MLLFNIIHPTDVTKSFLFQKLLENVFGEIVFILKNVFSRKLPLKNLMMAAFPYVFNKRIFPVEILSINIYIYCYTSSCFANFDKNEDYASEHIFK